MFETTRYEARRRLRGTGILAVAISLYSAFIVWYFTIIGGIDAEEVFRDAPPAMIEAFGIDALNTMEGYLGAQIFMFLWLLGLGIYFAYTGAGLIADDIENRRMDLLGVFPISRVRLLGEKFLALLLPILGLNIVVGIVIYGMVLGIGESIDPVHLTLAHLLSIPYFLVCAAIGMILSVLVNRAAIAERVAMGLIFLFWLGESIVSANGDFGWLASLSPTHYYEATPVVIEGSFDPVDSIVLLGGFAGLYLIGALLFKRRDL